MRVIVKILLAVALPLAALVLSFCGWLWSLSSGPYQATAQLLENAPPISSYPSQFVAAFISAESPDALAPSRFATMQYLFGAFRTGDVGGPPVTPFLLRSTINERRDLVRGLAEIATSFRIDIQYSSDKILSAYLSNASLGIGVADQLLGVSAASSAYFGKTLVELQPAEIALIVGLFRSPSRNSPYKYPERAKARRAVVLEHMLRSKVITEDEFNEAIQAPLPTPA